MITDAGTGFDDFGARYYRSDAGRFLTPDKGPWLYLDPQSYNRYVYALDDPMRYVDQQGATPQDRVNEAESLLGVAYQYGGKNPITGLDCSGLVLNAFLSDPDNGVPALDTVQSSSEQAADLMNSPAADFSIQPASAQPGDAIFFKNAGGRVVHVGIVVGIKDGRIYFIDAPNKTAHVRRDSVSLKTLAWGSRGKKEWFAGVGRPREAGPLQLSSRQVEIREVLSWEEVGLLLNLVPKPGQTGKVDVHQSQCPSSNRRCYGQ